MRAGQEPVAFQFPIPALDAGLDGARPLDAPRRATATPTISCGRGTIVGIERIIIVGIGVADIVDFVGRRRSAVVGHDVVVFFLGGEVRE